MKKTLAVVSFLVLAIACAAPPTNRDVAETNRNANVTAEKTAPVMTEADAIAKEKAIWESIKNKDYDAFGSMLAPEQIEVLDVAVHDKAGSIEAVKEFEPNELAFSDWKYLTIDKDAFIVAYTVNMKGKFQGKEFAPQTVRGSSAWVYRDGKWLAIFHQECPLKPPMTPAPTPATSPKPTASASVAPVAVTTGPDPIANDKLVWELFRSKNYDAFANLLAPEFIEIEPDNVYDKAAAVKGVQMFDASKWVQSDFKSVTIDADAAVVTYIGKEPKMAPKGERHSSIWVNRNGKWVALLHHGGTPVVTMPPAPKAAASPATKSPATK
ncbi:MAG TPA: nuclear transport factor 2 family protein [Pyrinomonadaceae bacterium]|nr:nuclear transport factor 2 family protein [Pyrinomonadaceae bacterium]